MTTSGEFRERSWIMRSARVLVLALVVLPFLHAPLHGEGPKGPVILISIDGFRPDYLERNTCPNIKMLASEGTRAEWLIPVFPTKTFPNHYSIATGMYTENHGVVGNTMYDPQFDAMFAMRMREEVSNARWWGGEPFWVTAEKQGVIAAPFFWPGSEAPIGGMRPSFWKPFDQSITEQGRVDQVLQWLDLPADRRPGIVTLYFDRLDNAGHQYGPDYAAVDTAIRIIDGAIGMLVSGLKKRELFDDAVIIILSDHGMAPVEKERTIYLDDYLPAADSVRTVDWGVVVSLWPKHESEERVYRALQGAHPHMLAFMKDSIPARWHYRNHRRVAPIVLVADEGWTISSRTNRNIWSRSDKGGNHGFDNRVPSMRGIFLAHGPVFTRGRVVAPFENIQIYNLLCSLLQIVPAPNDGEMEFAKSLMQQ